jgi:hypothetical protein
MLLLLLLLLSSIVTDLEGGRTFTQVKQLIKFWSSSVNKLRFKLNYENLIKKQPNPHLVLIVLAAVQ